MELEVLNTRAFDQPVEFGTRAQQPTFALDVGPGPETHSRTPEAPPPPAAPGMTHRDDMHHQAGPAGHHDQGPFPDPQQLGGKTVLHLAAEHGHAGVVRLLLERYGRGNADVHDGMGDTALHHATRHGHLPVVEALVASNVSLDIPNSAGRTPLQVSVMNGDAAMVQFLLDHGAHVL